MIKDQPAKYKNTFCFGAALSILGIGQEEGKEFLKKHFEEKELKPEILDQNFSDLEAGFTYILENCGDECSILNLEKTI